MWVAIDRVKQNNRVDGEQIKEEYEQEENNQLWYVTNNAFPNDLCVITIRI